MKTVNSILRFVLCFLLTLASILQIININCFDYSFYEKESRKLNTAENISVSKDDLDLMFVDLLDYLKDRRDNIDLQVEIKGEMREVYNEREKLHMVDVKDLYQKAMLIKNISFGVCGVIALYLAFSHNFNGIYKAYLNTLKIFGFICGFIALFCIIDFNSFWMNFHKIFFTKNDFWLLDPRTDIMINMVPEKFFFDLVVKIVIEVIVALVIYFYTFKIYDKEAK